MAGTSTNPSFTKATTPDGRTVHIYPKGSGRRLRRVVLPKAPVHTDPYAALVDASAQLEYGPKQRDLASATRAQTARENDIKGWFANYQASIANAATQNQVASQQAQGNLAALGTAASASDQAGQQKVTAQMQQDAASRGATVDPQLAVQMQQGSQVRAGNLAGASVLQSAQGFNQGAVDRQKIVGSEGSKVAALIDNASKVSDLRQQGVDLTSDIGAFKVSQRESRIKDDRAFLLQKFLAESGVDAKEATLNLQEGNAKLDALDKAGQVNQYGYADADWRKMTPAQRQKIMLGLHAATTAATARPSRPAARSTPESPYMTPAQQRSALKQLGSAKSVAAELKGKGGDRGRARQALLNGINKPSTTVSQVVPDDPRTSVDESQGGKSRTSITVPGKKRDPIDELTARVALDQEFNPGGALSAETVRLLHAAGIQVKTIGATTRKVRRVVRPNPDQQG